MAISDAVASKLIDKTESVFLAIIGAYVFVRGFTLMMPLTYYGVEALGIFGAYFGLHKYTTSKYSPSGTTITKP